MGEFGAEQQSCLQLLLDVVGSQHYVGLHRPRTLDHGNGHMGVFILTQIPKGIRELHPDSLNLVIEAVCGNLHRNRFLPEKLSDFFGQRNVVLQSDMQVFCNLLENLRNLLLQIVAILINH